MMKLSTQIYIALVTIFILYMLFNIVYDMYFKKDIILGDENKSVVNLKDLDKDISLDDDEGNVRSVDIDEVEAIIPPSHHVMKNERVGDDDEQTTERLESLRREYEVENGLHANKTEDEDGGEIIDGFNDNAEEKEGGNVGVDESNNGGIDREVEIHLELQQRVKERKNLLADALTKVKVISEHEGGLRAYGIVK